MMLDGAKDEESKYPHLLREPDSGTFHNLSDGAIVNVNGNNLRASYIGGDGNDLILTVVLSEETQALTSDF